MGIKERFEMILHFVQCVSHAGRVRNGSYMLLAGVESELHTCGSRTKKMPFHAINVSLPVRINVVRRRRNNSRRGSGADGRKRRSVGGRCGLTLASRQGNRKYREQKP